MNQDVKRNGYDRLIMEHVERWATAHECPSIELDYWVMKQEAAAFYESVGFQAKRQIVVKYL